MSMSHLCFCILFLPVMKTYVKVMADIFFKSVLPQQDQNMIKNEIKMMCHQCNFVYKRYHNDFIKCCSLNKNV